MIYANLVFAPGIENFFAMCAASGVDTVLIPDLPAGAEGAQRTDEIAERYIRANGGKIDYIHGVDSTAELGARPGNAGIVLPGIAKNEFFETVIRDGAFPRKTFSMGEATEKRFYMEGKSIKQG